MSIAVAVGPWPNHWNDLEALLRLQNILVHVCRHNFNDEDDNEYKELRKCLLRNNEFNDLVPPMIRSNRDLASFDDSLSAMGNFPGGSKKLVRDSMGPLLERAEDLDTTRFLGANLMPDDPEQDASETIADEGVLDSVNWTGEQAVLINRHMVSQLAPSAIEATSVLISYLESNAANGGPPVEERDQALSDLRELHRALGDLLSAAESVGPIAAYPGLVGEVVRFGRRVSQAFSDDPVPYALSGVLFAICTAFGSPTVGSYAGGTAVLLGKKK